MADLDPNLVRISLKRLSDSGKHLFGADRHQFATNPTLSSGEVSAFEQRHKVALPAEYRHFISHIGNGGAGPYYGVFPLGQMDYNFEMKPWHEGDDFVGVLSAPFPLRGDWNDLSRKPSEKLNDANFEEEYYRQLDEFQRFYWGSLNGAFPICHMGCALRIWLVVSDEEAGQLWLDRRADYKGLSPLTLKNNSRATFSSWYQEWLDDALEALRGSDLPGPGKRPYR